jgi:GABA permease
MVDESPPTHRLLVLANETCPCPALHEMISEKAAERELSVVIVAPALNRRLRHWVSDVDEAVLAARERLQTIVTSLRESGIDAQGEIGDARPAVALDDQLALRGADELVISTHPPGDSHWLEKGLLDHAARQFPGLITHFTSAYGAPAPASPAPARVAAV